MRKKRRLITRREVNIMRASPQIVEGITLGWAELPGERLCLCAKWHGLLLEIFSGSPAELASKLDKVKALMPVDRLLKHEKASALAEVDVLLKGEANHEASD